MPDFTAKIRAKGLDSTGVTEEIAGEMHAQKGKHYMAIVELRVDETHDKADGQHKVDLILTQVEPATDAQLDSHLRELTRTLDYNRRLNSRDGQLQIETRDDLEPTVEAVTAAGMRFKPHPFTASDLPGENGVCDACGEAEAYGVHQVDATDEEPKDQPAEDPPADPFAELAIDEDPPLDGDPAG